MDPSFLPEGDLLRPTMSAASVWSDEMVNGHHIGGLVAWAIERDHGDPDLQLARLTVDMFRPVPMRPLRLVTRAARTGHRLRAVDVSVLDGDTEVTRGSALLLRRGEHPDDTPWAAPEWDMPDPDSFETGTTTPPGARRPLSWEVRRTGDRGAQQGRVWMRELVPFVAGQDLTPMVRAGLSADFVNPLVNAGRDGLAYINVDLTLYLARDPVGEWIGMESTGHLGADGIALGTGALYDRKGRIGHAAVAGVPDNRLRTQPAPPPEPPTTG